MMSISSCRAFALVIALAGVATSAPILQTRDDTVELHAQELLLDLVVTDGKGRPVLDLRRDEVSILEDGTPQELTSFGLVRADVAASEAASVGSLPGPLVESPYRGYNLIMIVVDWNTVQTLNMVDVRRAAERFVNERATPRDLVAVFAASTRLLMLQNFTNHKPAIINALRYGTGSALGTVNAAAKVDAAALRARIEATREPSVGINAPATDIVQRLDDLALTLDPVLSELADQYQSRTFMNDMIALARVYGHAPGRKSVVLFSEGFSVDSLTKEIFDAMISAANRNNISFYTVDAAGLRTIQESAVVTPSTLQGRRNPDTDQNASMHVDIEGNAGLGRAEKALHSNRNLPLRLMADGTGGTFLRGSNDLNRGFAAVEADLRSYYALSYAVKNPTADGKFRSISVRVSRPNVQVRSRSGYYAVAGGSGQILVPYEQPIMNALDREPRPADLTLSLRTDYFRGKSGWAVPITMGIDASALTESGRDKGEVAFEVDALVLVKDPAGQIVARRSKPNRFRVPEQRLAEFRSQHVALTAFYEPLSVPPGDYRLVIAAYEPSTKKCTVLERPLKLLPLPATGAEVALSSLVLSKGATSVDAATRGGGFDPFVVDGAVRVNPLVNPAYSKARGDRLLAFFRLYGTPGRQYNVQLRFMRENKVVVATPPAALPSLDTEGEAVFSSPIPLEWFEPGVYRVFVDISAPGSKQGLASATAGFRVDG